MAPKRKRPATGGNRKSRRLRNKSPCPGISLPRRRRTKRPCRTPKRRHPAGSKSCRRVVRKCKRGKRRKPHYYARFVQHCADNARRHKYKFTGPEIIEQASECWKYLKPSQKTDFKNNVTGRGFRAPWPNDNSDSSSNSNQCAPGPSGANFRDFPAMGNPRFYFRGQNSSENCQNSDDDDGWTVGSNFP